MSTRIDFIKSYVLSAVTASATERGAVDVETIIDEAELAWNIISKLEEAVATASPKTTPARLRRVTQDED